MEYLAVILIWRLGDFHLSPNLNDAIYIYILIYSFTQRSMAGLFKYFTRLEKPTNSGSLLTKTEVEEANKAVAKVLESTPKTGALRGKYNSYTSIQWAELGK